MARPGRIRTLGPVVALLVPVGLIALASLLLSAWPCDGSSCAAPYVGAWGLLLLAVPTALLAGLPWFASPVTVGLALASSAALWVWLGVRAGRLATTDIDATWGTFWRELGFSLLGVGLGVALGGLVMVVVLSFL